MAARSGSSLLCTRNAAHELGHNTMTKHYRAMVNGTLINVYQFDNGKVLVRGSMGAFLHNRAVEDAALLWMSKENYAGMTLQEFLEKILGREC